MPKYEYLNITWYPDDETIQDLISDNNLQLYKIVFMDAVPDKRGTRLCYNIIFEYTDDNQPNS